MKRKWPSKRNLSVYFPRLILEAVKTLSKKEERSFSGMVVRLLEEALKSRAA